MNPFRVGDRVKFNLISLLISMTYSPYIFPPQFGEEFIVTCVEGIDIGFVLKGKKFRKGKKYSLPFEFFTLVRSAEDIDFDNKLKQITNPPSFSQRVKLFFTTILK